MPLPKWLGFPGRLIQNKHCWKEIKKEDEVTLTAEEWESLPDDLKQKIAERENRYAANGWSMTFWTLLAMGLFLLAWYR